MIHVAGNSVLDILVRDVGVESLDEAEGWQKENVQFLPNYPRAVIGGNGGAAAYLLGRIGNEVSLNTRIGEDVFGRTLQGWMSEAGVELVGPETSDTAVNVVLLTAEGSRRSIYYTGHPIAWDESVGIGYPAWFYAAGFGQVTMEDLKELTVVFEKFRAIGARVMFDPGPWFFRVVEKRTMERAYAHVDCLVGTLDELSTWQETDAVDPVIRRLLAAGPTQVVVKRGGEGASYGEQDGERGGVKGRALDSVNTVGAGDAFNAGLIHGLYQGETLKEAVGGAVVLGTEAARRGAGVMGVSDPLEILESR